MTKSFVISVCLAVLTAAPVVAQDTSGDPETGEKVFGKCRSCHSITDADGEAIAKGGRTGPNLYAIAGRTAGTYPDFSYSDDMVAAGEKGLAWSEADFMTYVADPSGFLKAYLDDPKARGKMTFKLRKDDEAADVWAYLVSVAPGS